MSTTSSSCCSVGQPSDSDSVTLAWASHLDSEPVHDLKEKDKRQCPRFYFMTKSSYKLICWNWLFTLLYHEIVWGCKHKHGIWRGKVVYIYLHILRKSWHNLRMWSSRELCADVCHSNFFTQTILCVLLLTWSFVCSWQMGWICRARF